MFDPMYMFTIFRLDLLSLISQLFTRPNSRDFLLTVPYSRVFLLTRPDSRNLLLAS